MILTEDNVDEVFSQIKGDKVLIALTTDGYEDLATNLSDIRSYIQQQQKIIIIYKKVWQ